MVFEQDQKEIMSIIAIIGRTCSGKSSLSQRVASELHCPNISVGSLIRSVAEEDETVQEQYIGPNGFADEFVAILISRALSFLDPTANVVIEGSIGFGLALEGFKKRSGASTIFAFHLECSPIIRNDRFKSRNELSERYESPEFFKERELLFDKRLEKDIDALKRIGTLFTIDCEEPLEVNQEEVLRILIDLDRNADI